MHEDEWDFTFKKLFVPQTTLKVIHWIVIVGIIVYFNMLFNGFVGDDELQVVNNPIIHSVANIPSLFLGSTFYNGNINNPVGLYYRPAMSFFYAILYQFFGPVAFPFHLVQLLLHILNSILVFLIFRYFIDKNVSFILSLIFLIHPINVESVAYISALQDILFFFFGSLAFYLELRMKYSLKKYIWLTLLLLFSLLAKETGVLFIVAVFTYELFFNNKYIKIFLTAAIFIISLYVFFRLGLAHIGLSNADTPFAPILQASLGTRLLNFPFILIYYFNLAFLPIHLAISQQWLITNYSLSTIFVSVIIVSILITVFLMMGYFIYRNHKKYFHLYFFFTFWLFLGLFFHSQILVPLDFTVADRWFYFPLFGLLGVIGIMLQISKSKIQSFPKIITVILLAVILISLSIRTIMRNSDYKDNITLYSHDVKYSTESGRLNSGLAAELMKQDRYKEAEPYLRKAVELSPNDAKTWNALGLYYQNTEQYSKAKYAYNKSISLGQYYLAYQNYALLLLLYDKPETSEKFIDESLQIFPTNGFLWQLRAITEHIFGRDDSALEAAKNAVMYAPSILTNTIYDRLSKKQSLDISIVSTKGGNILKVCPPVCN